MARESKREKDVWNLLVRTIEWREPADGSVRIRTKRKATTPPKFQVFEVIVATIFARICPDYAWFVTPVASDGGVDFVGEGHLFEDSALGVSVAIKVGGQCKKAGEGRDPLALISASIIRMAGSEHPTFFVVALSARVSKNRIRTAQTEVQNELKRDCHIFDRVQIEGLMLGHLDLVDGVLRQANLNDDQRCDALQYLRAKGAKTIVGSVEVSKPTEARGGEPFRVHVRTPIPLLSGSELRVGWCPASGDSAESVRLLDPVAAEDTQGIDFSVDPAEGRQLGAQVSLEMVSYSVGTVDLGELVLTSGDGEEVLRRLPLGEIPIVETSIPRFFEPPLRPQLSQLAREFARVRAGGASAVAVVGSGGSGKSRLCEEFAQRQRRRGCAVISAAPVQVFSDPYPLLVDLLSGLAGDGLPHVDPATKVIEAVAQYDSDTATRAEPGIRAAFGVARGKSGTVVDQSVIAALVVLIVARSSRTPLILHLKDLHWCGFELLEVIRQLVWQLEHNSSSSSDGLWGEGVLILLEGRIAARQGPGGGGWTSELFEDFLRKLRCKTVACSAFKPEHGLEFVRRLFETGEGPSASIELKGEQQRLVEEIFRSAGGNPFHSLEQVRILKDSGVIDQNPKTGLMYLIRPDSDPPALPPTVAESIEVRWRFIKDRTPGLALLVWGSGLLEDRVPMPLFRKLLQSLAPEVSLREVSETEILWAGNGEEREVAFRHEHYFRAIRNFEVAPSDRERVVRIYSEWLARKRSPADRFKRARALLEHPDRDVARAQRLMGSALRAAREQGNLLLARLIATRSLDVSWEQNEENPLKTETFLRRCDDELGLVRELLGSDRSQAERRLAALGSRLETRLSGNRVSPQTGARLQRRQMTARVLESQILFNARRPALGADVAGQAMGQIRLLRQAARAGGQDEQEWKELEVEALHSQSAALALSGEISEAIRASEEAVDMVGDSTSPLGHRVLSTYANITLGRNPRASEELLRECLSNLPETDEERDPTEVNLAMALVVRAYGMNPEDQERSASLKEARSLLIEVSRRATQSGDYPIAGAAALMLGIVCALDDTWEEAASRFGQAVAATARGSQLEALWRAHINFANALLRTGERIDGKVHDHARAALVILEETLAPYAQPDRSPRFALVRVPLAQAVAILIVAGDDAGRDALERYPGLRPCFEDTRKGILREDRGGFTSYEWLRIGTDDYVIY